MSTPFNNWTAALRADIDDAVAYRKAHPAGLNGFQASGLAAGLFPRIERRLEQVRRMAETIPELEAAIAVLQEVRDRLWELLAPWWDPEEITKAEQRLLYGRPGAEQPAGILAAPKVDERQDLRLVAQRALVRNHFGLTPRPAPVRHHRPHTRRHRRHATPPGALPPISFIEPDGAGESR